MLGPDKLFRWFFNIVIFVMCFQMGALLFLKSLQYKAEQRMKENEAQVSFTCGDFNNEESYWELPSSQKIHNGACLERHCPESLWVNEEDQPGELHVVSVERFQPSQFKDGKVEKGNFVDVLVEDSSQPTTLVLISQGMMLWNINPTDEGHPPENIRPVKNLKEVIVISPNLVWVEGLSSDTKVTYFSEKQLCAFPTAWEEIENPQNQFRRLYRALHQYTGLKVTSFQGKKVGREFHVPLSGLLATKPTMEQGRGLASDVHKSPFDLGVNWQRQGKKLKATSYRYFKKGQTTTVTLPEKAIDGYYEQATKTLFVINKSQFGTWDWESKKFNPIHLPLKMPALYWPTALAFNPLKSEIFIYNDDRGGEVLAYNVVTKKWRMMARQVGYSLVSLHFDSEKEVLYGTRFQRRQITDLVQLDKNGRVTMEPLAKPFDFSKSNWRAKLLGNKKQMWLKVAHPANPEGELHPLSQDELKL